MVRLTMEHYTKEAMEEARQVSDFYIDLIENDPATVKYYLADNAVLDWFGKSMKGKMVPVFLKDTVSKVTHHMTNAFPADNVEFKECHRVKVPRAEPLIVPLSSPSKELLTPLDQTRPSTSTIEMGQGDGLHNCGGLVSPPKKLKFSPEESDETVEDEVEDEGELLRLKYVTVEGTVEFHRPSLKKMQTETKWRRPSKLHIGYTENTAKNRTIYLIIYQSNLKCRRNLFKDFCESEARD